MASAHSNIHRLRPQLRLVVDNADCRLLPKGGSRPLTLDDSAPPAVGV